MATSGVISLHLRSRNPKSHYTRCSGRNPTQKNAPPFPLHVGTPTGGVKISRAHSEPIVRLREGRHFLALKFHRASPQTPVKKRANIANAIATHMIPRPCLQNLATFSGGASKSQKVTKEIRRCAASLFVCPTAQRPAEAPTNAS